MIFCVMFCNIIRVKTGWIFPARVCSKELACKFLSWTYFVDLIIIILIIIYFVEIMTSPHNIFGVSLYTGTLVKRPGTEKVVWTSACFKLYIMRRMESFNFFKLFCIFVVLRPDTSWTY